MARVIVRAVALPGTPLLVPGVAGSAVVLADTRAHVLGAFQDLAAHVDRVVVVAVAARGTAGRRGVLRPTLEAVGVEPRWWGWAPAPGTQGLPAAGLAGSVGLLALAAAGWDGPVEVVELEAGRPAGEAGRLVRALAQEPGAGLVVVTCTVPDAAARAGGPAADSHGAAREVEREVLGALGDAFEEVVERSVGEYEHRTYEVVRFVGAPAGR
ncbi:hypothetical protein OJAG_14620 [Oerskovia enterophila]|uniref:Uncharacterized protein n=1 Tax=Oerskovia enterophila TaxID=43678 RepID=A0A163S0Q3_9CELL|nr:hypothetical protein OJAG_14620 [Oerskovia enterophila]